MFEKFKKEESPGQKEISLDNFPIQGKDKIKRVEKDEFRKIIEKEKPEKIFAEYSAYDDLGPWGSFYIRRSSGEIVEASDHYPITKKDGSVDPNSHYSFTLDKMPYRLVGYPGFDPFGQYGRGKSKFVRTEITD